MDPLSYLRQQSIYGKTPPNPFGNGMTPPPMPSQGVDISGLRMGNAFDVPPINSQESVQSPIQEPIQESDPMGGFNPEHSSQDRYNQLMDSYPQEGKIGLLRKIGAVLAGLGGPNPAQDTILHGPHNAAVADWKNQIGPAEQSANMERYANTSERQTTYQAGQLRLSEQRNKETERKDKETEANRNIRTAAYEFAQKNKAHKFQKNTLNGHVEAVDPLTNEVTDLGKWDFSAAEDYAIKHKNKLEEIGASGEQARQTREVIPGGSSSWYPMQARQQYYNILRNLKDSNPQLAPFIHLDEEAPGSARYDAPYEETGKTDYFGRNTDNPTPEQYKIMKDAIDNNLGKFQPPGANPAKAGDTTRVKAIDENGNPVTVASKDVAAWLAENPKRRKR
jgi:hypothetical protein